MPLRLLVLGCTGFLGCGLAATLDNASLSGQFFFVHLLVTSANGQAANAQNVAGAMTFDGKGRYTYSGQTASGPASPADSSGSGAYTVNAAGTVTLTNPIQGALQISARLGGDRNVLVGATTESTTNINDVFIAIRAPSTAVTNAVLSGVYTGASLQFPNGQSAAVKSAVVSLTAAGNGQFSNVTAVGHSADQSGTTSSQQAAGSTYAINSDGTGTANFGSGASLFTGTRAIFVSPDGAYILGYSISGGIRDIFAATKNFGPSASAAAFNGRYWIAELLLDPGRSTFCEDSSQPASYSFQAASGVLQALGDGRALYSERLHLDASAWDYSFLNYYSVNSDGTGSLTPLGNTLNNMALGPAVNVGGTQRPNTVVGAEIGVVNQKSCEYGFFFGVRAPDTSAGTGVYIDPAGVVNGASFAPYPSPLSPGAITSVFGSGLFSGPKPLQASVLPLPTILGGVQVLVNGTAAPLFYVSSNQINFQTPFGLSGSSATIQISNNGALSNQVTVPLASTNPGIFQYADSASLNRGIVLHADFSFVTASSPARPGETVILYLTGLGALNPAVPTGAANPTSPLSNAADPGIFVLFGGEASTNIAFAGGAPTYAGLNQINVTIPLTVISGPNVPVAIVTSNAVTDIVDIPISF
jgi:uncharacterized protein (TIGR03437 family)